MTDYAALAMSLKDNEAFQSALQSIRNEALERLANADATATLFIQNQQATIRVVDDIRGNLEGFIRSGKPQPKAGIA